MPEFATSADLYFPSVKNLAYLADAVYYQKFGSGNIYSGPNQETLDSSWMLLATAAAGVSHGGGGYYGAAYYEAAQKHLVIAHRGTDLTNIGALWADAKGIYLQKYTSQIKSAYIFTRSIVSQFQDCAKSITVTGHSLGAWLAQTSALFMEFPTMAEDFVTIQDISAFQQRCMHLASQVGLSSSFSTLSSQAKQAMILTSVHVHVVVFDSPGALPTIESYMYKYLPKYTDDRQEGWLRVADALDITTYLSTPNAINSCNMHIGSLYMMLGVSGWGEAAVGGLIEHLQYTFDSHSMKAILKFWQQSDSFPVEKLRKIIDWPAGIQETSACLRNAFTHKKFQVKSANMDEIRMSVFTWKEREFLEDVQYLRTFGVENEKTTWEEIFKESNSQVQKEIYNYFDCFVISSKSQIVTVMNFTNLNQFIAMTKRLMAPNGDLEGLKCHNLIQAKINERPPVYEAIYQEFCKEYIESLPQISAASQLPVYLQQFLANTDQRIHQITANHSSFISAAKIYRVLNGRQYNFGIGSVQFTKRNMLFLDMSMLTTLHRHVSIQRILSSENLKLIVIEISESDGIKHDILDCLIQNFINLVDPLCKLLLLSSVEIHSPLLETLRNSVMYTKSTQSAEDQIISFKDLGQEQKTRIMDEFVTFQGRKMLLRNIISQEELNRNPEILSQTVLIKLLRQLQVKIGSPVPALSAFEESYYISRKFHRVVVNCKQAARKQRLISLTEVKNWILVITVDTEREKPKFKENVIKFFAFTESPSSIFEWDGNLANFDRKMHRIILVDLHQFSLTSVAESVRDLKMRGCWLTPFGPSMDEWELVTTFGDVSLNSLDFEYRSEYNELQFCELPKQLVIIADEPGMGKSTFLKRVAQNLALTQSGPCHWIIFLSLDNYKQPLDNLQTEKIDLNSIIQFFSSGEPSNTVGTDDSVQSILRYLLHQEGRVTFFFDGMDEILINLQAKVFQMTKIILQETKARVWIASRPHLKSSLQNFFQSSVHTLYPLKEPERIQFLVKFWANHEKFPPIDCGLNDEVLPILERYGENLLANLRSSLNLLKVDSFIGVPLQLFMLATVSLLQAVEYYETSKLGQISSLVPHLFPFDSVFQLYQLFVKEKYRIALQDKCKLVQLEFCPWHYATLTDAIDGLYQKLSFQFLFPSGIPLELEDANELFLEVVLGVGIVYGLEYNLRSIKFIHRTLAEYFAANYIVNQLTGDLNHYQTMLNFLKLHYFLPEFDRIRFFMDHFIANHSRTHKAFSMCLNWNNQRSNLLGTGRIQQEDADVLGRTVLHYAMCYGNHEEGILWFVVQNYHLVRHKDVFECGFLSYACLLPHLGHLQLAPFQHCTWKAFVRCFHEKIYDLAGEVGPLCEDGFKWILWFGGTRVKELNELMGRQNQDEKIPCKIVDQIQTISAIKEFDREFLHGESQTHKFLQILKEGSEIEVDVMLIAMRGDYETDRQRSILLAVEIFSDYLKTPEQFLSPFQVALCVGGEPHVKIGMALYQKAEAEDKTEIRAEMLRAMTRDNFHLYINSKKWLPTSFEHQLWFHCNKQQRRMMASIMQDDGFQCVSKIVNDYYLHNLDFVVDILKVHQDQSFNLLLQALRPEGDRFFKRILGKAIPNQTHQENCRKIWKSLPSDVAESILSTHYELFESNLLQQIVDDTATPSAISFFLAVYDSVGDELRLKMNDKVCKGRIVKLRIKNLLRK